MKMIANKAKIAAVRLFYKSCIEIAVRTSGTKTGDLSMQMAYKALYELRKLEGKPLHPMMRNVRVVSLGRGNKVGEC